MSKRKVKVSIFVSVVLVAFVLISINLDFRFDRFGNSKISWIDCVQINNTKYYRNDKNRIIEASSIGNKIGEVTFNVSEKVSNSKYHFRDGDATFLSLGTEIYNLNKIDNAIAVKIGDQYYMYNIKK